MPKALLSLIQGTPAGFPFGIPEIEEEIER